MKNSLASFVTKKRNSLLFSFTEFKEYLPVYLDYTKNTLSKRYFSSMRIASINALVLTRDNKIFVQRRSTTSTHAPGLLDASIGGLCHIEQGSLFPLKTVMQRLEKELTLAPQDIETIRLASVHLCPPPLGSCMFDFIVTVAMDSTTLRKKVAKSGNTGLFTEFFFIDFATVSDFIISHALFHKDITFDAVATYLSILSQKEYPKVVALLAKGNITIGKK